ncbi:Lsr2 dimerization domain-containing protein [Actinomycetospora chibensis]|uniref:Lsr2 dimerization domain-containing protein n=1 Tax=Actinomycetospora chibensis TaxID=663606 RepID=UPI00338B94A8
MHRVEALRHGENYVRGADRTQPIRCSRFFSALISVEREADENVEYALDGVTYEIDLTSDHAAIVGWRALVR